MSFLFGQEHVDRHRATDGEEGHEWRSPAPPARYLNLAAHPEVGVQVKGEEREIPIVLLEPS